ncbi:unnamed protein product [Lymnaea stagnalis]|uniref:FAD dependent oxidoreductase domain-containing protein n=1 Tax=Lymnaea stagnalis TaxID=6523 RepID=A0AAV2I2M8_LYMST
MAAKKSAKVVIIGAGVGGLASGICVQQLCPDAEVEIVAELFSPDTTSDGSAGFWLPYAIGSDVERVLKFATQTYDHLTSLAYSPLAGEIGVQHLSGYTIIAGHLQWIFFFSQEDEPFKDIVDGFRQLTPRELSRFPKLDARSGYFYTTVQVDVTPYLQWLMKRFLAKGGKTRKSKVTSLSEFAGRCDVLVTCCSLGATDLLKDEQIFPTRGQIWRVEAPWVKHFYEYRPPTGLDCCYILPRRNTVVVGGTAQKGDWRTEIDEGDSKKIWDMALKVLPSLAKAKPVDQWAGLRPTRSTVRLEKEVLNVSGQPLKVVHNYGFGGAGVTIHWGCALEAASLVLESLGGRLDLPSHL